MRLDICYNDGMKIMTPTGIKSFNLATFYPSQYFLLRQFSDHNKTISIMGRQMGSTTLINYYALLSAGVLSKRVCLITPRIQSQQHTCNILNDISKTSPHYQNIKSSNRNNIYFKNGGSISILTAFDFEHNVQIKYDIYIMDNAAYCYVRNSVINIWNQLPLYNNTKEFHLVSSAYKANGYFYELWKNDNTFVKQKYVLENAIIDKWTNYIGGVRAAEYHLSKLSFDQEYNGIFVDY